jgi:hypothetical protein
MPTYTEKKPIPDDPVELMDLGMKIYARHCIMGEKSPLRNLQSNSWEENGSEVNNALRLHELIEEESLSKEYSIIRDDLVDRIKASILASHDLLTGIYQDKPLELGFWGFDIEE